MILHDKKLLAFFSNSEDKNIAYHVDDEKQNVDQARYELALKYGYDDTKLKYMDQVHSNIVQNIDQFEDKIPKCDALITNKIEVPLMVMVADCIPILFYDKVKSVIGVAHSGRVGTFNNISANVIKKMKHDYSCNPKDIEVLLGPSIQKCCYEVSQELADIVKINFGAQFAKGRFLDLQGIIKKQLLDEDILSSNIEILDICTKCRGENYFSYRVDKSCGRFCGVLMLKNIGDKNINNNS